MNKRLISILIANLFLAAPALAQDFKVEGTVSVGGINVDSKESVDASKLSEYRDLSSGGLGAIDVKGRGKSYWFDLFGENFGRDDQYIGLRGGADGLFKYRLYSDSLTHNFLFNGRTPYNGAGSTANTGVTNFPILNQGLWNNIDTSYKRRDDGVGFELQALNPWYLRIDANKVKQSGTKTGASSQGLSPGNGYVDLLFPTEYETKNVTVEGGYSTKTMHFSLAWLTSKFDNDNESITWQNGYYGNGIDRTYLPPNNEYSRLAGNATFRQLPLNSTFAFRFTTDDLKSSTGLATSVLGTTTGGNVLTGPSTSSYDGKIENETYTFALASNPAKGLDTRLYYNYYKRDDKSTLVDFNSPTPAGAGGPFDNEHFAYEKKNWGFDAYYRVNKGNRVGGGYDYMDTERERFDFDRTKDKKFFLEWKNTQLDNVAVRVKYTDLDRESNFLLANDGANANDVLYWNRFLKAYDVTDLSQKQWKVTLDVTPVEFLDLSFEGTWKENTYTGQVLGRLSDDRRETYFSISYGDPATARFTAFADSENVKYESRHRVVGNSALPGAYDPATPDNASNYNWQGTNKDKNWAFGLAIDVPATEKLMIKGSVVQYKSDGSVDFSAPPLIAPASYPQPIGAYDDSKRTSFDIRGVYLLTKQWTITGGYAYEKYSYKDAQYDGYRYTIAAANRADSYLNGYLANPNYKANIVYGMVSYKF